MDIFYLWSIVVQHNEDVSYSLNTSSHLASNMGLIGQTSHLQRQNNKVVVSLLYLSVKQTWSAVVCPFVGILK